MVIHIATVCATIALCGCTTESKRTGQDETSEAIETCVASGGQLAEVWSVDTQHGPVVSLAATDSSIVLASQDGSVEQWLFTGGFSHPSNGAPFADVGVPLNAIAVGSDGSLAGVDQLGRLDMWSSANPQAPHTTAVDDSPLTAIALSDDAAYVAVTTGREPRLTTPSIWLVDRTTGAVSDKLPTSLMGASSLVFGGDALFTAGFFYGAPVVERRDLAVPAMVTSAWGTNVSGNVSAMALDREANSLVAVGDGFVVVLPANDLRANPIALTNRTNHNAVGVALLPGGDLFATVGGDGGLQLWRTSNADRVATIASPSAVGIGVDPDGKHLFTSGADGLLHAFACH
jgi:WD40 repeat protein